jgi:hypothetical protein
MGFSSVDGLTIPLSLETYHGGEEIFLKIFLEIAPQEKAPLARGFSCRWDGSRCIRSAALDLGFNSLGWLLIQFWGFSVRCLLRDFSNSTPNIYTRPSLVHDSPKHQ